MTPDEAPETATVLADAKSQLFGQIYDFTDNLGWDVEASVMQLLPESMRTEDDYADTMSAEVFERFFATIAKAVKEAADQALAATFDEAAKVLLADIAKLTGDGK
ncbi:MAG: hypothetical protein Dbin4_02555 [Alphaproteobacteria bacterium]|nr:hypothetical protein [Alphaproteobacteria bacterium]